MKKVWKEGRKKEKRNNKRKGVWEKESVNWTKD